MTVRHPGLWCLLRLLPMGSRHSQRSRDTRGGLPSRDLPECAVLANTPADQRPRKELGPHQRGLIRVSRTSHLAHR